LLATLNKWEDQDPCSIQLATKSQWEYQDHCYIKINKAYDLDDMLINKKIVQLLDVMTIMITYAC
jgi:hypothetical protein